MAALARHKLCDAAEQSLEIGARHSQIGVDQVIHDLRLANAVPMPHAEVGALGENHDIVALCRSSDLETDVSPSSVAPETATFSGGMEVFAVRYVSNARALQIREHLG